MRVVTVVIMKDEGKGETEGAVGTPSVKLIPMSCFIQGDKPVS